MPAVILGLVLAAQTLATTPSHSFQFVGASGELALFVDDSTIVTDGATKVAWVIGVNGSASELEKAAPGSYSLSSHRLYCDRRESSISHMYVYSGDGDIVGERSDPYPVSPVAPLSAGELVYNYVCNGTISTDKIAKLSTLAEVKQVGRNWLQIMDQAQAISRTNNKP